MKKLQLLPYLRCCSLFAAPVILIPGCTERSRVEATSPTPQRVYHEVSWDSVWIRDGGDGARFGRPAFIAAHSSNVAVFDAFGQRLFVFSPTGLQKHLLDRVPEVNLPLRRVLDLKRSPQGEYVILDSGSRQVIIIDEDFVRAITIPLLPHGHHNQIVVAESLVGVLAHGEVTALEVMGRTGDLVRSIPLGGHSKDNPLDGHAQLSALGSSGRFAVTFSYRSTWLLMRLDEIVASGGYLNGPLTEEPHHARTNGGRRRRSVGVAHSRTSFIVGDELHVLAAGSGASRLRVIDAYRLGDATYVGSYRMPAALVHLSVADTTMYMIAVEGAPKVMALVPRCGNGTLLLEAGLAAC